MDESYHSLLAAGIEKKYRQLEQDIMDDIVRRIRKAGTITDSADWQIQRLIILGNSTQDIEDLIRKAVDGNEAEVRRLYAEVIDREYTRDRSLYEQVGKEFIPYEQNSELQQITNALIDQSSEELYNITKSMGFMIDNGHGGKVFTPLADVYNGYLDQAITGMANGAYDYNTLIRRMVGQMTASGLRTDHAFSDGGNDYGIDYASGWHNRIDVAARRALLTGFGQLTGRVTDMNAQRLGTQYFEVTWHAGARPDHAVWQGKVYTKEQLTTKCGLGTGPGLLGWNCRHTYYPFIPGISVRNYTDEWLAEQNAREAAPKRFRGLEYTTYEATQKQRKMETSMRAQRERVHLLRTGGADQEDITTAQCKYQAQLDEYKRFSKAMGLPEQIERVYTGRTQGRIAPSHQTYAKWQAEQINRAKERLEKQRQANIRAAEKEVDTSSKAKEVSEEYRKKATPGIGVIIREEGYIEKTHKTEISFADWLHDYYGGNIELLKEKDNKKAPDYLWRESLWDLKTVATEKAANSAIRKGLKQIASNPGGIFLDYGDNDISEDVLLDVVEKRMKWYTDQDVDIMIIQRNKVTHVYRYEKSTENK